MIDCLTQQLAHRFCEAGEYHCLVEKMKPIDFSDPSLKLSGGNRTPAALREAETGCGTIGPARRRSFSTAFPFPLATPL
jgi:hypothetical protein